MRHFLIMLTSTLALAAAEPAPNGGFEAWSKDAPTGWQVNAAYQGGVFRKVETGPAEGRFAVGVVTGPKQTFALFVPRKSAAKAGERVKMSIRYRGHGRFALGLYCYSATGAWVGRNLEEIAPKPAAAEWTTFEQTYTLPAITHPKNGALGSVAPAITVGPDSEFEFDDCRVELIGVEAGAEPEPPATPTPVAAAIPLALPAVIYAVAGEEFNLYFDNIAPAGQPGEVQVISPVGRQDAKRWRFVPRPDETGVFPLRVEYRDAAGKLLTAADTQVAVAAPGKPGGPLTILLVGDSLTDNPAYAKRLLELLRRDGVEAKLIGSHAGGGRPVGDDGVAHEGRGGWTFANFVSRWTDGGDYRARSPFLAAPGRFDFQDYLDRVNGGKAPDFITVMLGHNDIALATDADIDGRLTAISRDFDTLVAGFRQAAPAAMIGIALPPPPAASQDAFGRNYGTRIHRAQFRRNQFKLWRMLTDKCATDPRLSLIPVHLNLDCENNYPVEEEAANARNAAACLRQSNALHPAASGYAQIGDTFHAWLTHHR